MQSCQRTKTGTKTKTSTMTTPTAGPRRRQLMRIANANANALNNKSQFSPQIAVGQKRSSNILLERRRNGNGANKRTPPPFPPDRREGASRKQQLNCSCFRAVPGVTRAQEVAASSPSADGQVDFAKRYRGGATLNTNRNQLRVEK